MVSGCTRWRPKVRRLGHCAQKTAAVTVQCDFEGFLEAEECFEFWDLQVYLKLGF
jgi:hypothetical protein